MWIKGRKAGEQPADFGAGMPMSGRCEAEEFHPGARGSTIFKRSRRQNAALAATGDAARPSRGVPPAERDRRVNWTESRDGCILDSAR